MKVSVSVRYSLLAIGREGESLSIKVTRGPLSQLSAEKYKASKQDCESSYLGDEKVHARPYGSVSCRFTEQNVIERSNTLDLTNQAMFGKHKAQD